jgi:uncharacterized membrane protein YfcA
VPELAALLLIAFIVGALIGAMGVGGILLIPALATLGHLSIHEAMATALFTFVFTGVTGTVLFQRKGSIDWRITLPAIAGALLLAFAGGWLNSRTEGSTLRLLLAGFVVFAGAYILFPWRRRREPVLQSHPLEQRIVLGAVGCVSGLASGLTGVGGPVVSVPLMLLLGFPTLASVGASQVIQIIAALSGTAANVSFGSIDFRLAGAVVVMEVAGMLAGVKLAHVVNQALLRSAVGIVCVVVGTLLFLEPTR